MDADNCTTPDNEHADSLVQGVVLPTFTDAEQVACWEAASAFVAGLHTNTVVWVESAFHGQPVVVGTIAVSQDDEQHLAPLFILVTDDVLAGLATPDGIESIDHGTDDKEINDTTG